MIIEINRRVNGFDLIILRVNHRPETRHFENAEDLISAIYKMKHTTPIKRTRWF